MDRNGNRTEFKPAQRPRKLRSLGWYGGMIGLDVEGRRIRLAIFEAELKARPAVWSPPAPGYAWLDHAHVQGTDTGADLDFLKACRGAPVGRDMH